MTKNSRPLWRFLLIALAALSLLWLAGMLYLDFAYSMFPQVLTGGLKILVAGYLLLAVLLLPIFLLVKLLKSRQQAPTE